MDRPFKEVIHSDFLIHWTGKDIDMKYHSDWNPSKASLTNKKTTEAYLKRLKDILKYGLWMTKDESQEVLRVNGQEFKKPLVARACFTELKLSEARNHAGKFGRLGIGVKRYFLFDRLGSPMVYIQSGTENIFFPPYSNWFNESQKEYELFCFFKHMCSGRPLTYDLFSESEWRIIYSESIKKILVENTRTDIASLFRDPKDKKDKEIYNFYVSLTESKKPEYLIPLDSWFSIIIYPSPQVKISAYKDAEIRNLIGKVKARKSRTGCPDYERQMMPIELDLDACSHF